MSVALRAPGSVPQLLARPTPANAVWVTDAQLAEAFCRFSCHHRRHGSNVPGPLEARRRATKRKSTSLAAVELSRGVPDPAVMYGSKNKVNLWVRPTDHTHTSAISYIPGRSDPQVDSRTTGELLWWSQRTPEYVPSSSQVNSWGGDLFKLDGSQKGEPIIEISAEEKLQSILPRLEACLTINDVEYLIQDSELDLQHHPNLCEDIILHLLQTTENHTLVSKLLCHPPLNPPGSHNCLKIYTSFQKAQLLDNVDKLYRDATCRAIQLGLVPAEDFAALVKAKLDSAVGEDSEKLKDRTFNLILDLFVALESSAVMKPQDVPNSYFNQWWLEVASISTSHTARRLCSRLGFYAPPITATELSDITLRSLCKIQDSDVVDTHSLPCQLLATMLATADLDSLAMSLPRITEELVEKVLLKEIPENLLLLWEVTLSFVPVPIGFQVCPSGDNWEEFQKSRKSTITPKLRVLPYCWTAMALSHWYIHRDPFLKESNLNQSFRSLFQASYNPTNTNLTVAINALLSGLNLPRPSYMVRGLKHLFFGWQFDSLSRNENTIILDKQAIRVMSYLIDDAFYVHQRRASCGMLRGLCESVNQNLILFKEIAADMVMQEEKAPRLVTRMLQHNIPFKLAIYQSRMNEIQEQKDQLKSPEQSETALSPQIALDVLHYIAHAFAVTKAVSHRVSLRYAYWCYVYLQTYGGPIQQPILRALWQAGVTRRGSQGVNKTYLHWILRKIREIEGPEVAESLLFNSAFRGRRDLAMDNFRATLEASAKPLSRNSAHVLGEWSEGAMLEELTKHMKETSEEDLVTINKGRLDPLGDDGLSDIECKYTPIRQWKA